MATAAQAAAHLFLSERRFHELLDTTAIDRQERGQYDVDTVREQYIEHLRGVAAGRASAGEGGLDLTDERARVAKEQADGLEMKNARDRGELLPRHDVHIAVTGAFTRVRAKLVGLPSKVAPLVFSLKTIAEVRDIITKAVNEALAELAATRIAGVPASAPGWKANTGGGTGLVGGADAAADLDGESVGRPRKATKPRGKR